MLIDKVIAETKKKKCPCIVGLDPEWDKIPECYKQGMPEKEVESGVFYSEQTCQQSSRAEAVWLWAKDVIDAVADIVPVVKPQMAFYEVYGAAGVAVFEKVVAYAHEKGLIVVDDSKRNDIGNTARAYAFAHLAPEGPIKADFLTVSPFLGTDSIQPFIETAIENDRGIFVLVKTSNPGSIEISEARNTAGEKISDWLANVVHTAGNQVIGKSGYSAIGAVVGATFPEEAKHLRNIMKNNYFLVPGFGAQGGRAEDIVSCFNEDGLGALVSSSRGILYHYEKAAEYDGSREAYRAIVQAQTQKMQREVYDVLKASCGEMEY